MKNIDNSNNRGFTLIELLAVIVILGLLIGIAYPAISKYINNTRDTTYSLHEADMKTAASNMMSQCLQNDTDGCLPKNGGSKTVYLADLIDSKYSEVIRDPGKEDAYCSATDSYVVVTNSNNNVAELDYQVCLVCSNYKSEGCSGEKVNDKCDSSTDVTPPRCENIVGGSTVWTKDDRVVSIGCSDSGCGCEQETYYKRFTETGKTGKVTIKDRAGNKEECEVNVYVDKEVPTCELEVIGSKGKNDWYGGKEVIVKLKNMKDSLSGVATYGMGTSKKNYNFDKSTEYVVKGGISTVYGYVKDNAGNVGTCQVEIKYDNAKPTQTVRVGYQVYPNEGVVSSTSSNAVTLKSLTSEYGRINGAKIYFSSNPSGMSSSIKNGGNTLVSRTVSAGVTEMEYTFNAGTYNNLVIDVGSGNVGKIARIELLTDHTTGFYTNKDVTVYVTSHDSFSGKSEYSFNKGGSWTTDTKKTYSVNTDVNVMTKDLSGNTSDNKNVNIKNIDKLVPKDAVYGTNGGTYTITVGNTSVNVSSKITSNDSDANSSYAKSDIRSVWYQWTTNTTQPNSWVASSNGSVISKAVNGGNNYLWVKSEDKAGNIKVTRSNDFNAGYQVVYNCNGGSGCPANQRKVHGQNLTLSSTTPNRSGYDFLGWGLRSSDRTVTYAKGGTYSNNSAVQLYAIWRKTITITFKANGGNSDKTATCYMYNSESNCTVTSPNSISRTGYTIQGYGTSQTASATWAINTSKAVSANATWYAIWKANTYTVVFNGNGYSGGSTASKTCTYDSYCTLTGNGFYKTGYTFNGWATTASGGVVYNNNASVRNLATSGTVNLYAKWKANTYTIAFYGNGANSGSTASKTCTYDSYCTLTANGFYRTGYTFSGWATSSGGGVAYGNTASVRNLATSGTVNLYAKWSANSYTLTYNNNGGSGCGTKSVTYDSTYGNLCTPSRTGYKFDGWYTAASGGSAVSTTTKVSTAGNHTLYAHWSLKTYTVTYLGNGGTHNGSGQYKDTATYGQNYYTRSNMFTRSGYNFAGWKQQSNGSDWTSWIGRPWAWTYDYDVTLVAQWKTACSASNPSGCQSMYVCKSGAPDYLSTNGMTFIHSTPAWSGGYTKALYTTAEVYVIGTSGDFYYVYVKDTHLFADQNQWYDKAVGNYGYIYKQCLTASSAKWDVNCWNTCIG